ncbi:MAG: ribokinase [Clostridia bacterium]|nr:ribokinase [Clostridia bacterium]
MKILNFGSLNLDYVYRMHHFIRPGETAAAIERTLVCGGKGLNQSIAIARSGAVLYHAGNIGAEDGTPLRELLLSAGVNVDYLRERDMPGGHTVIQVNDDGENAIILYPGANACTDVEQIRETLSHFDKGDLLVLQNEISCIPELIRIASEKGMKIAMNPSPVDGTGKYPLNLLHYLFVNEAEAAYLAGTSDNPENVLRGKLPDTSLIITCGAKGALYVGQDGTRIWQPSVPVQAVDTTAAGDTFMGYFLGRLIMGEPVQTCLQAASYAAALSVMRPGAAPSIPVFDEVVCFMNSSSKA